MRHWCQLATRNWRAKPGRTATSVLAIALGVGLVVSVSCCYESLRSSLTEWVVSWLGRSQIHIEHRLGAGRPIDLAMLDRVVEHPHVELAAPRSRYWMTLVDPAWAQAERVPSDALVPIDCYGIDPRVEYRLRGLKLARGSLLREGDDGGIVLQGEIAETLGASIGDTVTLADPAGLRRTFTLIGTIVSPQLGMFQRGRAYVMLSRLQAMTQTQGKAHTLDVLVHEGASVSQTRAELARHLPRDLSIQTSDTKLRHINDGMRLLHLVLLFNSICALLAAVFVIVSAMTMGVVERMTALGMLRCVGATRGQIAAMVFLEAVPVGLVGIGVGLGVGIVASQLAVHWYEGLFGQWRLSVTGLQFAAWGGLAATVVAAAVPAVMAAGVSPMTAARPRSVSRPGWLDWAAAGVGVVCLGGQALTIFAPLEPFAGLKLFVIAGVPLLVVGCVLIAPLVIRGLAWLMVPVLAAVFRVRRELLVDPIGRSGWRNASICCAMMVGLAFMLNILTNTESIIAGWQFPRRFPDALLWSFKPLKDEQIERGRQTPGLAAMSPVTAIPAELADDTRRERTGLWRLFDAAPMVNLVGVDLDSVQSLMQLRFVDGQQTDAFAALARGGAVVVAKEYVNTFGKGLGDDVDIIGPRGKTHTLRIVGVVDSPGIDVATDFFDQRTAYQARAAGAMITTRDQCLAIFGTNEVNLLLLNFALGDPDAPLTDEQRERGEQATVTELRRRIGLDRAADQPVVGANEFSFSRFLQQGIGYVFLSARQLKLLIDQDFRRGILWLVFAAGIAMVVSALGVGNAMMANIASRARQIAILRAIGTTRGQVMRMVLAEALALGVVGAMFGVAVGLYMAIVANHMDTRLFGFEPVLRIPWGWLAGGVGLTIGACLLAAVGPTISASRTNVAKAMQAR